MNPRMQSHFALTVLVLMRAFLPINASAESSDQALNLGSPEATVRSFTIAATRGDTNAVQACFLKGGEDYDDIRKVMESSADSPGYMMKAMLAAIDAKAAMPIIEKKDIEHGTKLVWRVTFKRQLDTGKGHIFKPGSTCDLDATLKKQGDRWLIHNF